MPLLVIANKPRSRDFLQAVELTELSLLAWKLHLSVAMQFAQPITRKEEFAMSKTLMLAASSLALLAAGCAAPQYKTIAVPDNLRPATGESLAMIIPAKGVQIYECRASKTGAGYEWAFVAPEAGLMDGNGKLIGRHYAGPHWEAADGSKVQGALQARAEAPAAGSIPWLLLGTKSVGPAGAFSKVTHIQRVNTVGGVAPRNGCSQAAVGTPARVGYTADYYFFTAK
jgi:hypothetical protein